MHRALSYFCGMAFYTPASPTQGEYKEKGSKFLAFAWPVTDEGEVKERLEELRKTYYDARHHCYAYVLGTNQVQWRANDDGEPNHSAGDPILGQIRSHGFTNCLVVVVRYFGGTKLGVPGLVNAYKTAAADALQQAAKLEILDLISGHLTFGYDQLGTVERWVTEIPLHVHDRRYLATCSLAFEVEHQHKGRVERQLSEYPGISLMWD